MRASHHVYDIQIVVLHRKEANMLKLRPILLSVAILLIVSAGCAPAGSPTSDSSFISTAVAQTFVAGLVQTSAAATLASMGQPPTATPTFAPELPTLTTTPIPVFTSTPSGVPQVSVSVNTNCRFGPGKAYDRIGSLLVGEVAEVLGRNPAGTYWYIRNPDATGSFCWLWGEYATVSGNTSTLPVYAPPASPTPSPSFLVSYDDLDTCAAVGWWVEFELENTGGLPFKSISLTVKDTDTNVVVSFDSEEFTNRNGCNTPNPKESLEPGDVRRVSSAAFNYDPNGNQMRATITLCTGNDLKGSCETQVIKFKA